MEKTNYVHLLDLSVHQGGGMYGKMWRSHFPIFHIGLGEFKRNLMQIKSALAAAAMAVRFLTPWRYPIINAFIGISFYYIAESIITEIDPCQD